MRESRIAIGGALLALIVVLAIGAMWIFGFGLFQRGTAEFRGGTAAREQIVADPNVRIQAYNHFFDLCASVQAAEDRLGSLEEELAMGVPQSRADQITASMTAVRSQRMENIRQYNNDAAKDWTIGQFKDFDLPYNLDPQQENTQCVVN